MDIDELQTVQSRERQTDSLQQLRDSFYTEASEFIEKLRAARDDAAERADDPWDNPEVNRLSDEIKTAEQTAEAIYDRRVGKIVKKASLAAADMPTDEDGLTAEEQALFDQLVANIEDNRNHVLDMVAGEVPSDASPVDGSTAPDENRPQAPSSAASDQPSSAQASSSSNPTPPPQTEPDEAVSAADVMDPDTVSTDTTPAQDDRTVEPMADSPAGAPDQSTESSPDASAAVDRQTVKITKDVGEIFGVDQREYDLSTDDVVTLPADNAEPLVERDAAKRLD